MAPCHDNMYRWGCDKGYSNHELHLHQGSAPGIWDYNPTFTPPYQAPLLSHGILAFAPFSFLKEVHYFHLRQNQFAPLLNLRINFTVTSSCLSPHLQIFNPLRFSVKTLKTPWIPPLWNKSATLTGQFPPVLFLLLSLLIILSWSSVVLLWTYFFHVVLL